MNMLLTYILRAVCVLIVCTVFELSKAFTSTILGDPMPKKNKRLSLDPRKNIDPLGFLMFFFTGYGWSNPAQTSQIGYKDRKTGTLITNLVPIAVCFVLAMALSAVYIALPQNTPFVLSTFVAAVSLMFLHIAVFNIIPVFPMTCSAVVKSFLNVNSVLSYKQMEKIILMIIMFGLFTGYLQTPLDTVCNSISMMMFRLLGA